MFKDIKLKHPRRCVESVAEALGGGWRAVGQRMICAGESDTLQATYSDAPNLFIIHAL
ncbi:MAG: hypothetical protein LBE78_06535 [Burkholderiaceae bacterium]|jgi:hypothetical protein|nr:hypothetical protein [Burkholderiaceae bacterium]